MNEKAAKSFDRKQEERRLRSPVANPDDPPLDTTPVEQATASKPAGRNDPCPCGSGQKYKKCHGKNA